MSEETEVVLSTVDNMAPAPVVETETKPEEPAKKVFEAITNQEELDKRLAERLARQERHHSKQLREERDARIRAEARAEAKAEERGAQTKADGKPPQGDAAPKLADYVDFDEYLDAKTEWKLVQHEKKSSAEREKTQSAQQSQFQAQQKLVAFNKRVEAYTVERPDYSEILSNATTPLTKAMTSAILDSEKGPALAIYLVEHPEEAQAIAANTSEDSKESEVRAVRALTLIEAGFAKKPVTKTPEPISPTGARQTSAVKSMSDPMSQDEYEKRRRAFRGKR